MTATTMLTSPPATETARPIRTTTPVWRTGATAGAGAALATSAVAALARAVGVPLTVRGQSIPVPGFAELTFVAAIIGTVIASVIVRRASRPRRTFVRTTLALTALSFVPDVTADAHTATKLALVLSHVVAAAIVIPALASRLSD
jgi:hypothetical protein